MSPEEIVNLLFSRVGSRLFDVSRGPRTLTRYSAFGMFTVGVYLHVVDVAPGEATVASTATNAAWKVPFGRIHCPVGMWRIDTWTWPTPTLSVRRR